MDRIPPTSAPLPRLVRWFSPWRWMTPRRWVLFGILLLITYVEAPVFWSFLVEHSIVPYDSPLGVTLDVIFYPLATAYDNSEFASTFYDAQFEWFKQTFGE